MQPIGYTTASTTMRRDVFQAIADPTRREIIGLLAGKPLNVNDVSDRFNISRPAVSKHLKILMECGLVAIEEKGRERICHATPENLSEVADWVAQYKAFWNQKLDSLERYLSEIQQNK